MVLQQSSWNVLPVPLTGPELEAPPLPPPEEDEEEPDEDEPVRLVPRRTRVPPVSESGSSPHESNAVESTQSSVHTMLDDLPRTSSAYHRAGRGR